MHINKYLSKNNSAKTQPNSGIYWFEFSVAEATAVKIYLNVMEINGIGYFLFRPIGLQKLFIDGTII